MRIDTLALLLQGQAAGLPEHRITDIFKPLASPAGAEAQIAELTLAITGTIFLIVGILIVTTLWRFRAKPGDDAHQEPAQVYGSNQIEIAWTAIPILIVFILIGVSARVIASVQNAGPPPSALKVRLVGHQWWWEIRYTDYGFVDANEINMPASPDGKMATYFELQSADVLHSIWIPQLAGKLDLIPNRTNYTWMDPRLPGIYFGNCAEYCGTQHAYMLLRVVARAPSDFQAWAAAKQKPAAPEALASEGRKVFDSLACVNCHAIRGTRAAGTFGPDLTHLMGRQTIGSGVVDNSHANLRAWVDNPQDAKPGCLMPSLKLSKPDVDAITAYLELLK